MPIRSARAQWRGTMRGGDGMMAFGHGGMDYAYSFSTRFEEKPGHNPEELIAAAEAGCFSMALAGDLEAAGFPPNFVETTAQVTVEPQSPGGFTITRVALRCTAGVPGIDNATFQRIADGTKATCPVSKALAAVPTITLEAILQQGKEQAA